MDHDPTRGARATAERLAFRGGPAVSLVPLGVFLATTVALLVAGTSATEGMIVAAMAGLSCGMLLARSPAAYSERVFALMANRTATVAVVCWLWAGAFSGILRGSGLVEAVVWLGWQTGITGAAFTVGVFLCASLFAVSVGSGLATVVGFTAVFYPAGVALGAHPGALMGAIFSGGAFGDNLAPVSDTTIVSAATQEADVGAVVRSRLKYVLVAAGIAAGLFALFGGAPGSVDLERAESLLRAEADPRGLPLLVPAVIVFLIAVRGGHFLAALSAGIATALVLGPLAGVFTLADVFHITPAGGIAGYGVEGAMSLVPTAVLTLLLVSAIGMLEASGFLERVMEFLSRTVATTVRGAELAIVGLVSLANLCVSVNTVAMITVGPLANELRRRHDLAPNRAANLLDTVSCSFPYILPYAATFTAALDLQRQVAGPGIPVLAWSEQAPYIFYGIALFPLMILAAITGWGRRGG